MSGSGWETRISARAQVSGNGTGYRLVRKLKGVKKVRQEVDMKSGQKISPVKEEGNSLGTAPPRPKRTLAAAPFPEGLWGRGWILSAPRGARPLILGQSGVAVSAALGRGGRGRGHPSPASWGRSCRWRGQAGREPNYGDWPRLLEAGVRLDFIRSGLECRGLTGRAEPEVEHPTRAKRWPPPAEPRRLAVRGELKFKCDPRRSGGGSWRR